MGSAPEQGLKFMHGRWGPSVDLPTDPWASVFNRATQPVPRPLARSPEDWRRRRPTPRPHALPPQKGSGTRERRRGSVAAARGRRGIDRSCRPALHGAHRPRRRGLDVGWGTADVDSWGSSPRKESRRGGASP